jgi:hypothetical protein
MKPRDTVEVEDGEIASQSNRVYSTGRKLPGKYEST